MFSMWSSVDGQEHPGSTPPDVAPCSAKASKATQRRKPGSPPRAAPALSAPHAPAGGAAGEERTPVLEWREAVVVPPGESVHALQPQQLRAPRLWWPLHLGDQARDGRARP